MPHLKMNMILWFTGIITLLSSQGEKSGAEAATEGTTDVDKTSDSQPDLFEENFKELKKWADVKSPKYGSLLVLREKRCGRLGTALKVVLTHWSSSLHLGILLDFNFKLVLYFQLY